MPLSRPRLDFYVLLLMSTIIATFGLLLDNPSVIIGAMLIAPLMDPILGLSFSSLTQNGTFAFRSTITLVSGILLAILVSLVLSVPFPNLGASREELARTEPSLLDLFTAMATGFVAGYAKVRKDIGGALYGVAVSISLVPPLCVVGIGLSTGRDEIYTGASLLFLTNLASILFSGILAFLMIRLRDWQKSLKSLIFPGVMLGLLAIPLSYSLWTIQKQKMLQAELQKILLHGTHTFRRTDIAHLDMDVLKKPITLEVTIRSRETEIVTPRQIRLVEQLLEQRLGVPVVLTVNISPIIQIKAERDTWQNRLHEN